MTLQVGSEGKTCQPAGTRKEVVSMTGFVETLVELAFGIARAALHAPGRGAARVAFARQVAIYLSHVRLGLSYSAAGRFFGRDRTTAAHACRVIEERREEVLAQFAARLPGTGHRHAASGRRGVERPPMSDKTEDRALRLLTRLTRRDGCLVQKAKDQFAVVGTRAGDAAARGAGRRRTGCHPDRPRPGRRRRRRHDARFIRRRGGGPPPPGRGLRWLCRTAPAARAHHARRCGVRPAAGHRQPRREPACLAAPAQGRQRTADDRCQRIRRRRAAARRLRAGAPDAAGYRQLDGGGRRQAPGGRERRCRSHRIGPRRTPAGGGRARLAGAGDGQSRRGLLLLPQRAGRDRARAAMAGALGQGGSAVDARRARPALRIGDAGTRPGHGARCATGAPTAIGRRSIEARLRRPESAPARPT